MALAIVAGLPPTKPVDDDYTAVRKDVLAKMNLADINLPGCEAGLAKAQNDLQAAQAHIVDLEAAARELQSQKALLKAHITALETVLQREPGFAEGWEEVDGPLGLAVGWGVGTAQCVGLAWVFNQKGFRR
jgi:hypothetical protein